MTHAQHVGIILSLDEVHQRLASQSRLEGVGLETGSSYSVCHRWAIVVLLTCWARSQTPVSAFETTCLSMTNRALNEGFGDVAEAGRWCHMLTVVINHSLVLGSTCLCSLTCSNQTTRCFRDQVFTSDHVTRRSRTIQSMSMSENLTAKS